MYFDCALTIAVFEIAVYILKIQRCAQYMEVPRKNSSLRQRPCHNKYKDNFDISKKLT